MVLIEPVMPVVVLIKIGQSKYTCRMVSLSQYELVISASDYLEKASHVIFHAKYFHGRANIHDIKFDQDNFKYTMHIEQIKFKPGLLINTSL